MIGVTAIETPTRASRRRFMERRMRQAGMTRAPAVTRGGYTFAQGQRLTRSYAPAHQAAVPAYLPEHQAAIPAYASAHDAAVPSYASGQRIDTPSYLPSTRPPDTSMLPGHLLTSAPSALRGLGETGDLSSAAVLGVLALYVGGGVLAGAAMAPSGKRGGYAIAGGVLAFLAGPIGLGALGAVALSRR